MAKHFYKEVDGDLIELALKGEFDVIAHGCNCFCTMGAGIAPQMAKAFGCDKHTLEGPRQSGNINKLGQIGLMDFELPNKILTVVNAYTQYGPGFSHRKEATHPLSYPSLILCLQKMNKIFKGMHIGLPQIGCGLAGGDWASVKGLIEQYLTDCDVTVVIYKPKENVPKHQTKKAQGSH